jgi:hypothetical protein
MSSGYGIFEAESFGGLEIDNEIDLLGTGISLGFVPTQGRAKQ